ncbi:MAG TPA: hypothetical protein PLG79_06150 [Spirochaetales bacterium]|nr:hypothetical protein [Spirochaetales bacterium]
MQASTVQEPCKKRKSIINSVLKLIFSDEGIHHSLQLNLPLQQFRLSDDTEKRGILLKQFAPRTVQRMILQNFISSIEMPIESTSKKRMDIMDVSKLIAFAMLYIQFDLEVWDEVCNSDIVRTWNRQNPKYPIDHRTRVNSFFLKKVMQERESFIHEVQQEIFDSIQSYLKKDSLYTSEDAVILDGMIKKFIGNLRQLTWFFLSFQPNTRGNSDLKDRVVEILYKNLKRTSISEYIGLLMIELVTFLETEVKNKSAQAGTSIIWKMRSRRNISGERAKLSIVICDRKTANRELGAKISNRANIPVEKVHLSELYQSKEGYETETLALGLYYLAFLKEACKSHHITFDAFVNNGERGENYINLIFLF